MVKSLQYFAVIGLFSILLTSGIAINASALPEHVPNVARFVTSTTDSTVLDVYESKGCSVKYVFDEMSALDCPPAIGRLMGLQQDIQVFALDTVANDQVKATDVQATGLSGSGIVVAVLDTGIDCDGAYDWVCDQAEISTFVADNYAWNMFYDVFTQATK